MRKTAICLIIALNAMKPSSKSLVLRSMLESKVYFDRNSPHLLSID